MSLSKMEPLHTENRVARSKIFQWSEGVCYNVEELLIFDLQKKKKKKKKSALFQSYNLAKHTLNTYFSGMEIDPKNAFFKCFS